MLSGQANDYFGDTHHLRGGSPTPNESSLRTGLTPGGSARQRRSYANALDFHRTAMSAAAKRDQNGAPLRSQGQQPPPPPQQQQPSATICNLSTPRNAQRCDNR
ncbi:hypothetical protein IWW34DRAFT_855187 [Fusarium oxysporum f. sp. albedinis]|nr:hypothetical protein IWW34DRAFT_855187 [Fusarium oxysporum f. sp. albedinis]